MGKGPIIKVSQHLDDCYIEACLYSPPCCWDHHTLVCLHLLDIVCQTPSTEVQALGFGSVPEGKLMCNVHAMLAIKELVIIYE